VIYCDEKRRMIHIYQKRKLAYIGVDVHKEQHTAIAIDCWNNVLGEVTFENRPGKFDKFICEIKRICGDLMPVYGLEDTHGFGRNLAVYLIGHKFTVKHVNPALGNAVRLSAPTYAKNDGYDAYCVARVLRDMIDKLPDSQEQDIFWTIRQLIKRRDALVKGISTLQNQLHGQLMYPYPSYTKFFCDVDGKTAMYFWEKYPSPECLKDIRPEELGEELKKASRNALSIKKAYEILLLVEADGNTKRQFQSERDFIVRSIVKEIRYKKNELTEVDAELLKLAPETGYRLETMPGIDLNTACHFISEIGDINRFPNSDKLAQFAGLAPVAFTSAGKGRQQRSRQGNRALNALFYMLAMQLVQVSASGKPRHPVFHEYFNQKINEGISKPQALLCVQRRAIRIIFGMMRTKTEYRPYERS